jgi:hypothetical protein
VSPPTIGDVIVVAVDGTISALKRYRPTNPPTTPANVRYVLYNATTQAELGRGNPGTESAGWNTAAITPVAVTAGTRVIATVYGADWYAFTPNGHAADLVVGNLTAPATANDPIGNGRFKSGADGYPNQTFGGHNYGMDVIFDATPNTTPVSSTLTAKWRVYEKVTSTFTGKWHVLSEVLSALTAKWKVWGKVSSTLTAKWHILTTTPGPTTGDPAVLEAQRRMTAALIADDPTTIELIPYSRVATATGGFRYQAGTTRAPQTVKMSLLNFDQRPTTTVAGVERLVDYHLIGPWNMAIAVGDIWYAEDDTTWEVLGFSEGWDYMTKAFIGRHVPRDVRP